ncbi:hypothetical protein H9X96_20595 [Pedobacter sp. N36a]|uniref:hypothetical protein n=1 Tax=Pedobacter sp. N36a TaxID=2767996 RepID=UPI0016574A0C|nr:hypothetical protein [Pedobacter sp. N36a]MBC8988160.1 hypothetical protein [Pedobacter sp. N36a]
MVRILLLLLVLLKLPVYGQDMKSLENKLHHLSQQREKWSHSQEEKSYDSLARYNKELELLILKFTANNPKTLSHKFDKTKVGLDMLTSTDGLFRIYTWNTLEGGTMQYFKSVYQYNAAGKVYSMRSDTPEEDNGCLFMEINDLTLAGKRYYLSTSISVGSSALYYYQAKVFSIENGKLNPNAKLIKTKSGIKNVIGYEVDLSSSSNRDRKDGIEPRDYMKLQYDRENKTILIPLINADGRVTKSKIKYQLKGQYFEKI